MGPYVTWRHHIGSWLEYVYKIKEGDNVASAIDVLEWKNIVWNLSYLLLINNFLCCTYMPCGWITFKSVAMYFREVTIARGAESKFLGLHAGSQEY